MNHPCFSTTKLSTGQTAVPTTVEGKIRPTNTQPVYNAVLAAKADKIDTQSEIFTKQVKPTLRQSTPSARHALHLLLPRFLDRPRSELPGRSNTSLGQTS